MRNNIVGIIAVAVAALLLAAVAMSGLSLNVGSQAASSERLVETIKGNGNFTKLAGALNSTGLSEDLNGSQSFTVFAPTDAAFDALNQTGNGTANGLNLTEVLKFHVVEGMVTPNMLTNNKALKTLEGSNLSVYVNSLGTFVNGAKVDLGVINASNGAVYSIDKVLVPQTLRQVLANQTDLSQLTAAIDAVNMSRALNGTGPFTLFAPTDTAFGVLNESMKALLASNNTTDQAQALKLLRYHLVSNNIVIGNMTENQTITTITGERLVLKVDGDNITINGAKVLRPNLIATNGVVQVVDQVLVPPMSILETAKARGLTSLVAAVESANLTEELNASGPFTVFAPTDAAFDALNATMDQENLTKVLLYHVIAGETFSWELENASVTTLNGQKVNITVSTTSTDGNGTGNMTDNTTGNVTGNVTVLKVNNATIVMSDILCSNGVIHVIDQVLMPSDMNTSEPIVPAPDQSPTPPAPQPPSEQPQAPTTPSC